MERLRDIHQLAVATDGFKPQCDAQGLNCTGAVQEYHRDYPERSEKHRLGGSRYSGFFEAPHTGNYTFMALFDDAGEVLLSTDENPRNAQRIIHAASLEAPLVRTDVSSGGDDWFGLDYDPTQLHLKIDLGDRGMAGALFISLTGSGNDECEPTGSVGV